MIVNYKELYDGQEPPESEEDIEQNTIEYLAWVKRQKLKMEGIIE